MMLGGPISSAGLALMLLLITHAACVSCSAQAEDPTAQTAEAGVIDSPSDSTSRNPPAFTESRLTTPLLKNLLTDQKAIWTSPFHLRWEDSDWLIPLAGITAGVVATDRSINRSVARKPQATSSYVHLSDYGLAGLVGGGAGLYLIGKFSHDDHRTETGILAAEAAIDTLSVTTSLKYIVGRERPYQDTSAPFFHGGDSFPSDHSAVAWSVASVLAHEYPGTLTQMLAYGLATAVSVSRVNGEQHSASDVLVSAGIGWFIGQYVYSHHHDPELAGSAWESLPQHFREQRGEVRSAGSPYVPLDSWVYPALDRLIALGFIHSAFSDLKPWTRSECAQLVEEAGTELDENSGSSEAGRLYEALEAEFAKDARDMTLEPGDRGVAGRMESTYTRFTDIAGSPLNDSYHFGQTVINDFGRPYEEGGNVVSGFSGWASSGRFAVYVRGEYQRAPSGPGISPAAAELIAQQDENTVQPPQAISAVSRFALLDSYVLVSVDDWQLSFGKQSLWWGPAEGGALLLSDNAAPILMFRARRTIAYQLPWILRYLGPLSVDLFVGQLGGNTSPARPLIHGQKVTFKPTRYFQFGVATTTEFGGVGRPITLAAIVNSYISLKSSDLYAPNASPGKRTIGMDFSYQVPHVRNWLTLYDDVLLPEDNPTLLDMSQSPIYLPKRIAQRPGIYLARVPGINRLDLRVEAVYTDPPTARSVFGRYIYWNDFYHDLYTNDGNIIGDWVGRQGSGVQAWSKYWFGPRSWLELGYRHAKVASSFIPGGETLNDGSIDVTWRLHSSLTLSTYVQYEKWVAPILAPGPRSNLLSAVEFEFSPTSWGW